MVIYMYRLKVVMVAVLMFLIIRDVTPFAAAGTHFSDPLHSTADGINSVASANNGLCPCGVPEHDDTGYDENVGDDSGTDDTGTDDEDDGNDNSDTDDTSNDNSDDECSHPNRCPVCDDCLDCGNNPDQCHDCCDDGRRCDDCIHCTFDIGVLDGVFQYTGSGITGFDGGFIIMGETDTGYWMYEFEPVKNTGAELDSAGFPLRVGEYIVTGHYNNGRYTDFGTSTLIVTPAPLTVNVLLESDSKVYDGNTVIDLGCAALAGIIEDDEVIISMYGTPSFISPDVGNDIEVMFTDFEIGGLHAWNYSVIQPDSLTANITRAAYKGNISVVINDDPLRIGSELTFTATSNASDYLIQWRVNGEDIYGANDLTYIVKPADVDKKITVKLISSCRNYEGESPPTDYIPYTINLIQGNTVPMGTDDVFFGNPGIVTTYAASKNGGFVDIDHVLYDSGLSSDYLAFSLSSLSDISCIGTGVSRYYVMPPDAVNGVITITATFYHRGILITPDDGHAFDDLDCGYSFDNHFTLTIAQLGNAPTGQITIDISGADYDAFYLSSRIISSIDINDSVTIDVGVRADNVPPGYYCNTYSANVDVSGYHVNPQALPVSVKVAHNYSQFLYRNGYHDRYCTGCKLYRSGFCSYSDWSVLTGIHRRSCSVCFGEDRHTPVWGSWGPFNDANHLRTCTECNITDTAFHTWGNWSNFNTANHRRACTTAGCGITQEAAHTWGGWSAWGSISGTHHRQSRSCTTTGCGRIEHNDQPHATLGWWNLGDGHHCARSCFDCSVHLEYIGHAHSGWTDIHDGTHCVINCTRCEAQHLHVANHWNHASGWRDSHNGTHCHRICSLCNRYLWSQGHRNWSFSSINDTQCRRTCGDCHRQETRTHQGHRITALPRVADFYAHRVNYDCAHCGRTDYQDFGEAGCLFSLSQNRCVGVAVNRIESISPQHRPAFQHIIHNGESWWIAVITDNRCNRSGTNFQPGFINPIVP